MHWICRCRRSRFTQEGSRWALSVLLLLGLSWGTRLAAQGAQEPGAQEPEAQEPGAHEPEKEEPPAEKSSLSSKITINGYLTQAYARSDGHQFLGITESGTADYTTAALRIRADMTPNDAFVLQLAHIRIGNSPIQQLKNDVDIEWLYYQHNFGNSRVKVGRVQIPFGIYNEVRDLGTVLPFYRPSHNFYGDAAFGSETLEGIVLTHRQAIGAGWGLTGDLHYGNWKFGNSDFLGNYFFDQVENSKGVELWVEPPLPGLRIGAGAMRYDIRSGNPNVPAVGKATWEAAHVSVAAEFDRFNVHSEVKEVNLGDGFRVQLGYAQLGVRLYKGLTLNLQRDMFYVKMANQDRTRTDDDRAIGLTYAIRPSLVLKSEHHWNEGGFWVEDVPFFGGGPTPKTKYWLVSLSTAF